jgi:heme oxygenase
LRNPVHQALRDATAAAHDRVDAAFADFDLTDRASYARFLRAHADVVWSLEAALPGERLVEDWESRKRGELLKEDLAHLRHPRESGSPSPALSTLPHSEETGARFRGDDGWNFDDRASIAGTLYVLEGSRLGGKFLARSLPLGFPRAYLDADQRGEKWQQLLVRIAQTLPDRTALDRAIAAAGETFAAFERSAREWRKVEVGDGR